MATAVAGCLLLTGCGGGGSDPLAAAAPVATPSPAATPAPGTASGPAPVPQVARPVEVRMPRLGIDAAMDPLHTDATGVLVPPRYGRAGWYEAGPEPGELGRAVIAGHVDSKTGPDTFAGLYRARSGDEILVRLADRTTLTFVVQRVGTYPRNDFPTGLVYGGPKRSAELRLITCTGPYDRSHGGYQDNLVVFARFVR